MEVGELIAQCAESKVHACNFYGYAAVVKHRFPKEYRHTELDVKLREQRTVREARAMVKCRKLGIPTPTVYHVNKSTCCITMERIDGISVHDFLQHTPSEAAANRLLSAFGELVGRLHDHDIIHGDLTTSNVLLKDVDSAALVLIDFGLVRESTSAEERAVDLYVLERAVGSAHPRLVHPEQALLAGYMKAIDAIKGKLTMDRLHAVRQRGRKRSMIG